MDIDLFPVLCWSSLGVAVLGVLCIGLQFVLRATILHEDNSMKWDFLRSTKDADKRQACTRFREERIRNTNDHTQRGDAS